MTDEVGQVDSSFRDVEDSELADIDNHLPTRLASLADEIAAGLESALAELARRWYDEMARTPQLVSWQRDDVRELILPQAERDIGRELAGLRDGRRLPNACPEEVVQSARLAALNGLPLWATLQSYRVGHAQQWLAWSNAVEARALPDDDRRALLRAGSDYFFAYADRCLRWAELEYSDARDVPLRRAEQRRVQIVARLLEGREGDLEPLGYELDRWHVGVVVRGAEAERAVTEAATRAGAELLTVAAEASTLWMWLGTRSPSARSVRELTRCELPAGEVLGLGEPDDGSDGFRSTHRQAQIAAALGAQLGHAASRYADVALEDLAGQDDERARAFVERELGPLTADRREAATLRTTLSAYFDSAQRASSAATRLGVHERTIGNRLRRVAELLGHPASARPVELEVALRLHRLRGTDRG